MTNKLKQLLHEARKGNPEFAYLAGMQLEKEGYDSFFVQSQYRNAANNGYSIAQRWLGILGLCNLLRTDETYSAEANYNTSYEPAIGWLSTAADNGDRVSLFILAKCRQLGIGMVEDEDLAEAGIASIVPFLADNDILAVNLLFDYIMSRKNLRPFELSNYCWELRGAPFYPIAG